MMEKIFFRNVSIILSGGTGTRLGSATPKQYIPVAGRPIIEHTLYAIKSWKSMDGIVIVADEAWRDYLRPVVSKVFDDATAFLGFSEPGRTRQESIKNALLFCNGHMADSATVMIHDAVRPLVTAELIEDCCRKMDGYDGVTPAIPIKDTVYISNSGTQFDSNIDRNTLYAGQTPEFFDYWKYYKVITGLNDEEINRTSGSSQPAVSAGLRIAIAKGNEENFKITTAEDLARFRKIKETGTKYRF